VKVFVSYYAKRNTDIKKVAISLFPPKWFDGECIKELAPNRHTFGTKDYDEYKRRYYAQLDQLSWGWIRETIYTHSNGFTEDLALCCFEALKKEGEWCHRTMLAEYLNERYNTNVKELV
jgi:hypothetical protein